jgi:nucleoid-associated protein YgaU
MVAIHIPRRTDDEWPAGRPADAPGSVRPVRPVPSRLPDRATRVRRRRLAVLVLAVASVAAAVLGAQAVSGLAQVDGTTTPQPVDVRPAPVAGQRYVVQPGDTLWSIAAQIAPDDDPRAVVDALRAANGGPTLEVGAELTLDVG